MIEVALLLTRTHGTFIDKNLVISYFPPLQICKDKVESEIWLAGLKDLISTGQSRSRRTRSEISDVILLQLLFP